MLEFASVCKEKVKKYTIMHEYTPVLEFNRVTDEIKIFAKELLPFGLRGKLKSYII